MVYEIRSYDIEPAMLGGYETWANEKALPLLIGSFGFDVVGFWKKTGTPPEIREESPMNIVWIIRWDSEDQRNERWKQVRASDAWKAIREDAPPFWKKIDSKFVTPVAGSPMQ